LHNGPGQGTSRVLGLSQSRDLVTLSRAKSPSPSVRDGFCTEFTLERSEGFRMTISLPAGGEADFEAALAEYRRVLTLPYRRAMLSLGDADKAEPPRLPTC